jgi:hypothetical protein
MVPDGDRHHGTQSARLEDDEEILFDPDDHVVVVFILHDHVQEFCARLSRERPPQDLLQRGQTLNFRENRIVEQGTTSSLEARAKPR